jgi:aubergine-like protein
MVESASASNILSRIQPAVRPSRRCLIGRPIPLVANFYRFSPVDTSRSIQKYSVEFEPDIPSQLLKLREKVIAKSRADVINHIGKYVYANTAIYGGLSETAGQEGAFQVTSNHDGVDYIITITPVGHIESPQETKHFYNKFFNTIQGRMRLVMIGRKFYNPDRKIDLPAHGITIWPGYASSVSSYEDGCLINIDISHRCLRTINCLDELESMRRGEGSRFKDDAMRKFVGSTVLTGYNKKCYRVDDIDWDSSPLSSFVNMQGVETNYKDYYETRWAIKNIKDNQPLLVSSLKKLKVFLIPELCYITGITDDLRANFTVMKDMANATKKEPRERLAECGKLLEAVMTNPKSIQEINDWRVSLSSQPAMLEGRIFDAGSIAMGNTQSFEINTDSGSFDREVQTAMFNQPPIRMWGIFHVESEKRLVDSFLSVLQQVIQQFQVVCEKPATFPIRSDRWEDWDAELRRRLNRNVQIIICILPGARGKSRLYDDLKRLTFSQFPVPSQVILNSTLKKDRGLRSVVNKVLIQINAKVGGTPWALRSLPLSSSNTMVVGIDIFHKRGAYSVLGFCATTDENFSVYTSITKVHMESQEISGLFRESMSQAMEEYKKSNGRMPERVIVFRDGVSDSQRQAVLANEIPQLLNAFEDLITRELLSKAPTLAFLIVNKRINARFFAGYGRNVSNPPLGTCVDTVVTLRESYDFYLTPAKANQGAMTPTHFHVIYDNTGLPCDALQQLSYRLCYGYYNWSGSIRVPAPCQYAHKLAYQYGERATRQGPPTPHSFWSTQRSLYFL